jgi:hypothetical protein
MQVLQIVKQLAGVPSLHSALHASYACTPELSTSLPACLLSLRASATAFTGSTPEEHQRIVSLFPDLTDPHILVYTCVMVANEMLELLDDIHQRYVLMHALMQTVLDMSNVRTNSPDGCLVVTHARLLPLHTGLHLVSL